MKAGQKAAKGTQGANGARPDAADAKGARVPAPWRYGLSDAEIEVAMEEVRWLLRDFRARYGLSQVGFAQRAQCGRSLVSMVETGAMEPGLCAFLRLSRGFPQPPHQVLAVLLRRARRRRNNAHQKKMSGS